MKKTYVKLSINIELFAEQDVLGTSSSSRIENTGDFVENELDSIGGTF